MFQGSRRRDSKEGELRRWGGGRLWGGGGLQVSTPFPTCRNEKLRCFEITRLICLTPIIFAITRIHRV